MRAALVLLGIALAAVLAACGTPQDMGSLLVSPGKYDIYTCPQIAERMVGVDAEGKKLEGLMARASRDAGGQFISNIAYESDYLSNRGEWRELQKSAADKNCPKPPPPVGSDKIIR